MLDMEMAGAEMVGWKEWSYCMGEEEIREAPGIWTRVTSVVIRKVFPWWFMAERMEVQMMGQVQVLYGFSDASKQEFGASIEMPCSTTRNRAQSIGN